MSRLDVMPENIIIGAGLVGSLLSIFIAKKGNQVEIYDQMPDIRKTKTRSGRSINLTLCDRGLRILDSIGVGEAVRASAVPVYGRLIHDVKAELTFQPYGNHHEAIYSISRSDLNRILLDYAERHFDIKFNFNEKCLNVELAAPSIETKNLLSREVSSHKAERIFGSDGAYSVVRLQMQKKLRLNFSQQYWEQGYKELSVSPNTDSGWTSEKTPFTSGREAIIC